MHDPLSDVFHMIRLKSCVYFQRDFCAPWAMRIEGTGFAQFHVVTRGSCLVEEAGRRHACSVGDVLVFPHGGAHTLADREGRDAVSGPEVMASFAGDRPYFADGDVSARLICGHYEYRSDPGHPLIAELPEFIHLRGLDLPKEGPILSTLPLLMGELAQPTTGSQSIVERYAEILLVQVLRIFAARRDREPGLFAVFTDKRLSRAVKLMHRDFASALGLEDLAREAALSRSAFAQRFKETAGMAPIEYLTKWRMLTAADLLKTSDLSVAGVSEQVGYESEISFARAFKREFNVTPSHYRRHS